jgi:hypothetical protein
MESIPGQGGNLQVSGAMTLPRNIELDKDGWSTMYFGPETVFVTTTIVPDSDYQARVLAVNCQGNASEPSPVMSFTTLHRSDTKEYLTPKNVAATFTIECTGDICVGDTILITERLFAKTKGQGAEAGASGASGLRSGTGTGASRGGGGAFGPGGGGGGGGGSVVRMDMSVTSLQSNLNAPLPGAFLGERTIAAYVTKDNYRTIRDDLAAAGIGPKDVRRFGPLRKLWLEVIWEHQTNPEVCRPYRLASGTVIERMQSHLEQFEVGLINVNEH